VKTDELDFHLPEELIAQRPSVRRDESRLLVVDRKTGGLTPVVFREIGSFLRSGDCLVMNDTRVIRARIEAHKPSGGKIEIFLLHEEAPGAWTCLMRPSAKVKPGTPLLLAEGITATAGDVLPDGKRRIHFDCENVIRELERIGRIPLPPYIHRDAEDPLDAERYQTVVARSPGAVAAPTAGLHYSPELLERLEAQGVSRACVTLHVGYGTFKPITVEDLAEHRVDPEDFELSPETAARLNTVRPAGGRVVAVGTTATRVLETQYHDGAFHPGSGQTNTYIHPPYTYGGVDVLQTNFHLPKSSLLALVAAFAGVELMREAYRFAIAERFRFYSYGDAMLIV
jgi:S-adenosylmethionine:tRNA ribosyltransferase-isomerase